MDERATRSSVLDGVEWTLDCQGKQDFDAGLVNLSTRYWPRGGGWSLFDARTGRWEENKDRPDVLPSACCSILWRDADKPLVEKWFEATTEAEVKSLVEAWATTQIERLRDAVLALYGKDGEP